MELEFLKKLSDRYASTSVADVSKFFLEADTESPAFIAGCVLILTSISVLAIYFLLSIFSAYSYKNRIKLNEDNSTYHLSSRLSSLEMTLAEYKNTIKHLDQKVAADKLNFKAEMEMIKSEIRDSLLEEIRMENFRKVA